MNITKILAVILIAFISTATFSQQTDNPVSSTGLNKAQKRADRMKTELSLSDDQYNKVLELFTAQGTQMKSLKDQSVSKEDRKAKMKTLRSETNSQMQNILTSDQSTKFKEFKKKKHEKRKMKCGKHGKKRKIRQ